MISSGSNFWTWQNGSVQIMGCFAQSHAKSPNANLLRLDLDFSQYNNTIIKSLESQMIGKFARQKFFLLTR